MNAYLYGIQYGMTSTQIAVRIDNELLETIDDIVSAGDCDSRAAVVRSALTLYIDQREQRLLDDAIVDGYQRIPPTVAEDEAALASLKAALEEESW